MEQIKETIEGLMRSWEKKKKSSSGGNPEALLKKALTKNELRHIKFNYFKKGVLGVSVDSSAWLYKLSLSKEDLLATLSKKLSTIKDIRFRIGEVK